MDEFSINQKVINADIDAVCTIERRPRGRGFEYFDKKGAKVFSREMINRFRAINVPPMWSDVRISEDDCSHVQAYGFDVKARKQYIYHPIWTEQRQADKFAQLSNFASLLPSIRIRYQKDVQQKDWTIEKVCALATAILDETGVRIGNKSYSESNQTYGLSTLRTRHIKTTKNGIAFRFIGKHKQQRNILIEDTQIARLILDCAEQPGYSIFRYQADQKWHDLVSDDINHYIKTIAGQEYSSKFFRTWVGTRLAISNAMDSAKVCAQNKRKRFKSTLIKCVSTRLGNTPAVCEKYYIHPKILNELVKLHKSNKLDDWYNKSVLKIKQTSRSDKKQVVFDVDEELALGMLVDKS
jgi:DNA topoisomerase-1